MKWLLIKWLCECAHVWTETLMNEHINECACEYYHWFMYEWVYARNIQCMIDWMEPFIY